MTIPRKFLQLLKLLLKSALVALFVVGLATYVFFCPPVLTRLCGQYLLFPFPPGAEFETDTINGVMREDVYFQNSHGDKLNGWFFQNPNKTAPVVLFNHGNAANLGYRVFLIKALMDAGASVFIYDYRQYGRSTGEKNLAGLLDDSESAYKYLIEQRKLADDKIVLYGESIGGGPACYLLQHHKVGGIILDSTFTSLLQLAKIKVAYFNVYPDFCVPEPAFDNKVALLGDHPPLLIIHGAKDILIPESEAQENFRAASQPKKLLLLANSDHNDKRRDFAEYVKGMKEFLSSIR